MTIALKTAAAVAGFLLTAPAAALAQNAITTDDTPLRAGPGVEFPRITIIPEDAGVRIHGCIAGYDWCDVSWRYERGWVRGRNLSYVWNGRYVIIEDWGPRIGLPVIGFSVRDYWTRYYSNRPFFEQRHTWFERDRRWERRDGWDRREGRDSERRGDTGREERREQRGDELRQRDEFGGRLDRREERREERRQDRLDDRQGGVNQRGQEQRGQERGLEQQRPDRDEQRATRREQREQQAPSERRERGERGERGERM